MENCFGQYGWKEFHRNRKDILAEFDKILEQTKNRPIQVAHGQGVEAYIRKWLSEFLPKKYGVTSGYIIPNLYGDGKKIYHYDIIIYNQIDSPILWTEGNADNSEQGKYRAIPAKYVFAVYEVKSRLKKSNINNALDKLSQTKDFCDQLNPYYTCGAIFIDLKESENKKESIIKELIKGKDVFGFCGGMVLRYEGDDTCTGLIRLFDSTKDEGENKHYKPLAKPIDDLNIYITEDGNLQVAESGSGVRLLVTDENNWSVSKLYGVSYNEGNKSVHLSWPRTHFSEFCIDLISSLEGLPYNDENRPSFGRIFDKVEHKKAPLQSASPESGKPFLELKLYEGGEYGKKLTIDDVVPQATIEFIVTVENKGNVAVIISDDYFKNHYKLEQRKAVIRPIRLRVIIDHENKNLKKILEETPLEILYRILYYPVDTDKEYVAIEKNLRITESDIEFV